MPSPTLVVYHDSRSPTRRYITLAPPTLAEMNLQVRKQLKQPKDADLFFLIQHKVKNAGVTSVILTDETWELLVLGRNDEREEETLDLEVLIEDPASTLGKRKRMDNDEEEDESERPPQKQPRHGPPSSTYSDTATSPAPLLPADSQNESVSIIFRRTSKDSQLELRCNPLATMWKIQHAFLQKIEQCQDFFTFCIDGKVINYNMTLREVLEASKIGKDDSLLVDVYQTRGGVSPSIFIFSPKARIVDVQLSLKPFWRFSSICPTVDIVTSEEKEETVTWRVAANPGGNLIDLQSGKMLRHLSWEPHIYRNVLNTPYRTPNYLLDCFPPIGPALTSFNAVLLPFEDLLPHLSTHLAQMTLSPSMQNDFLAYFLPQFIAIRDRNQQILLRFLHQEALERAAPLQITPNPQVVTRVFMIFQGVDEEESRKGTWKKAKEYARKVEWKEVVGVKEEARDEGGFRVLEWGGMEL